MKKKIQLMGLFDNYPIVEGVGIGGIKIGEKMDISNEIFPLLKEIHDKKKIQYTLITIALNYIVIKILNGFIKSACMETIQASLKT